MAGGRNLAVTPQNGLPIGAEPPDRWFCRLQEVVDYQAAHNRLPPASGGVRGVDVDLGRWLGRQRGLAARLTASQQAALLAVLQLPNSQPTAAERGSLGGQAAAHSHRRAEPRSCHSCSSGFDGHSRRGMCRRCYDQQRHQAASSQRAQTRAAVNAGCGPFTAAQLDRIETELVHQLTPPGASPLGRALCELRKHWAENLRSTPAPATGRRVYRLPRRCQMATPLPAAEPTRQALRAAPSSQAEAVRRRRQPGPLAPAAA